MTVTQEQLAVGRDLHKKASFDALNAVKRVVDLVDNESAATFIAMGGCLSTATLLASHLITHEALRDTTPAQLADAALFAMLFTYHAEHPEKNATKTDQLVKLSMNAFLAVRGYPFEKSWLIPPLREALG